jgi:hypothetical protein
VRRERLLLLILAATSFHGEFPGGGLRWVAPLGPYDEHLVRDVGAFFLALTTLTGLAAVRPTRDLVRTTAITWLVFQVPHLLIHLHLGPLTEAAGALQLAVLVVQLVLPVALLRRRAGDGDRFEEA